jgi:hypothetical protein
LRIESDDGIVVDRVDIKRTSDDGPFPWKDRLRASAPPTFFSAIHAGLSLPTGAPTMKNRSASKTPPGLLFVSFASLGLAQPAAALNADYWRGGWRTPLGDEPHIYEFVIRGDRVTGVYCRNCSDASTIGFIDGTWNEKTGIDFTVTLANPDGSIASVDRQHATLVEGRLIVTRAAGTRNGKAGELTLVKDPRGADPGGRPHITSHRARRPRFPWQVPPVAVAEAGRPRPIGSPGVSRRCGRRTSSARGSPRSAWA